MSLKVTPIGDTKTDTKSATAPPAGGIAPIPFSVLSYNVNFGSCYDAVMQVGDNTNAPLVIRAISESKADIVCLQETHAGWELAVRAALSEQYPNQIWRHPNSGYYASGLAILWTNQHHLMGESLYQPKVEGSYFPGQRATFRLNTKQGTAPAATTAGADAKSRDSKADTKIDIKQPATAATAATAATGTGAGGSDDDVIEIVNVHLRPPLEMGNGGMLSFANLKAYVWETTAVRTQELASYVNQAGYRRPHLVVGDCNEGSTGSAVSWMGGAGYNDALSKANTQTTWYWPLMWGLELWGSYDHLFHSTDEVSCTGATVYEAYKHASDHLPVRGTFVRHRPKTEKSAATTSAPATAAAAVSKPTVRHS